MSLESCPWSIPLQEGNRGTGSEQFAPGTGRLPSSTTTPKAATYVPFFSFAVNATLCNHYSSPDIRMKRAIKV